MSDKGEDWIGKMQVLEVDAPAKLNLCLHVLGRRADGYHELAMAMQRIDLCDRILIKVERGRGIEVVCPGLELAGGENIAARAAVGFLEAAQIERAVSIKIDKKIPVAAGLGGGSSDAAAVLLALNSLCGRPLNLVQLLAVGGSLGSDVPFFIFKQPAWATGTGTTLERLPPLPEVCYLLLNPGISVSTAMVYQSLQLTKASELANLPKFSVSTIPELLAALHNDLESVTASQHPEIDVMKKFMLEQGALGVLMSGSVASVFGVFSDISQALEAKSAVPDSLAWKSFVVRPL